MSDTNPATTATRFTEDEARRIRGVLGGLRFSGGLGMMSASRSIVDVDSLITWLDAFTEALSSGVDRLTATEAEYDKLKYDMQAAGRVLAAILPPKGE